MFVMHAWQAALRPTATHTTRRLAPCSMPGQKELAFEFHGAIGGSILPVPARRHRSAWHFGGFSHRKNNDMHYDPGLWGQFSIVHHFQVTWLAAIVWIHAGSDTVSRIPQSQTSASAVNERLTDKMADSKYARFNENRDYQVRKQMIRRTNLPVVPISYWEWILVFVISHTVSDFMNRPSLILTAAVRCQMSLGLTH